MTDDRIIQLQLAAIWLVEGMPGVHSHTDCAFDADYADVCQITNCECECHD